MRRMLCSLPMLLSVGVGSPPAAAASPDALSCARMARPPTQEWAPLIEKQMAGDPRYPLDREHLHVTVEGWDTFAGWNVVGVETGVSDFGYLFYRGAPSQGRYLTIWGGAPLLEPGEGRRILADLRRAAPGIPDNLARCFVEKVLPGGSHRQPGKPVSEGVW